MKSIHAPAAPAAIGPYAHAIAAGEFSTRVPEPADDDHDDRWNYAILLALYTLQGIPMGLSASIPFLIQQKVKSLAEAAAAAAPAAAAAASSMPPAKTATSPPSSRTSPSSPTSTR